MFVQQSFFDMLGNMINQHVEDAEKVPFALLISFSFFAKISNLLISVHISYSAIT